MSALRPLLIVVVIALAPVQAAAQLLDDLWFKVKVVAKGVVVDADDGALTPATYKETVYLHLAANGDAYDYQLWYEFTPNDWQLSGSATITLTGANDDILPVASLVLVGPSNASLSHFITLQFKAKLDKQGAVKSATVKTLAGVLGNATLDGMNSFEGSLKLTGKAIPPDKLPF